MGNKQKNTKDKTYQMSTGTTPLHHHLLREYLKLWVIACNRLNMLIKGNGTKPAKQFRQANSMVTAATSPETSASTFVPQFSQEAFIDAIIEWIIADDQVWNLVALIVYNVLMLLSQSM